MTQTHTCYEVSKRLKEFLGDSAPEPMAVEDEYPYYGINGSRVPRKFSTESDYPRYQLHDLLSKPFCEAMGEKIDPGCSDSGDDLAYRIYDEYREGGLPEVESCLMEMVNGK